MKKSKRLKRVFSFVLCVVMTITIIQLTPQNTYATKKVKLNYTKITLYAGEVKNLKIYEGKTEIYSARWSSSNKNVVKVTNYGHIEALKPGSVKITAKYNDKNYVCKVTVKDALKDHVSYELIDIPENKDFNRNNTNAIKIINNNDITVEARIKCKRYDKDGFYIGSGEIRGVVNSNRYIIIPISYDEYTRINLSNVYRADPIDIEYSISNPYTNGNFEYRDIIFNNNSNRNQLALCSILYYNSDNKPICINTSYSIKTNKIPAGEKIKISDRYLLDMKEKYDIERIEIYLY